jgi:hypothetical protein
MSSQHVPNDAQLPAIEDDSNTSTPRTSELKRPVLEGIAASIGSIGDAYDNALADTCTVWFETEAVAAAAHS